MSDKDILDFLVQCLVKNRTTNKNDSGSNSILNTAKNNILKKNIDYAIQLQINKENLDTNYHQYSFEHTYSLNF